MKLVVYVWRRRNLDPGHVVVGLENDENRLIGFRFRLNDIPSEFQDQSKWRAYLFDNNVPGYIVDETNYVEALKTKRPDFIKRTWEILDKNRLINILNDIEYGKQFANYSFQPDKHNKPNIPCYNCVTFAIMIVNNIIENAFDIEKFKSGRVKLFAQELEQDDQ